MTKRWSHYDRMAAHLAPAAEFLTARLGPVPGLVVDVGSGSGNGLRAAVAADQPVLGLDRAFEQLDAARAVGAPQVQGDVAALPFRTGSVAAATSNFGIIFAADPEEAFADVARCLRPGGRLAFTAWRAGGWPQPARDVLAGRLGRRLPPFPTALGEVETARRMLEAAGFSAHDVEAKALAWHFADVDAAVDELSEAAGGLRMLRRELEAQGEWAAAAEALRAVVEPLCAPTDEGVTILDHYVVHLAQLG
ncbi:MAG: class I SAM-dependent methyltransferase [Actinomycetota bacterium]